jgi:hypothetical protein
MRISAAPHHDNPVRMTRSRELHSPGVLRFVEWSISLIPACQWHTEAVDTVAYKSTIHRDTKIYLTILLVSCWYKDHLFPTYESRLCQQTLAGTEDGMGRWIGFVEAMRLMRCDLPQLLRPHTGRRADELSLRPLSPSHSRPFQPNLTSLSQASTAADTCAPTTAMSERY